MLLYQISVCCANLSIFLRSGTVFSPIGHISDNLSDTVHSRHYTDPKSYHIAYARYQRSSLWTVQYNFYRTLCESDWNQPSLHRGKSNQQSTNELYDLSEGHQSRPAGSFDSNGAQHYTVSSKLFRFFNTNKLYSMFF